MLLIHTTNRSKSFMIYQAKNVIDSQNIRITLGIIRPRTMHTNIPAPSINTRKTAVNHRITFFHPRVANAAAADNPHTPISNIQPGIISAPVNFDCAVIWTKLSFIQGSCLLHSTSTHAHTILPVPTAAAPWVRCCRSFSLKFSIFSAFSFS